MNNLDQQLTSIKRRLSALERTPKQGARTESLLSTSYIDPVMRFAFDKGFDGSERNAAHINASGLNYPVIWAVLRVFCASSKYAEMRLKYSTSGLERSTQVFTFSGKETPSKWSSGRRVQVWWDPELPYGWNVAPNPYQFIEVGLKSIKGESFATQPVLWTPEIVVAIPKPEDKTEDALKQGVWEWYDN
ncbi:hypothetical protein O1L55_20770 [Streptomyces albulus]|nr:hypothetical protein [Streptomyces noursei]